MVGPPAAWALLLHRSVLQPRPPGLLFSNRFWAGGGALTSGLGFPKQVLEVPGADRTLETSSCLAPVLVMPRAISNLLGGFLVGRGHKV
jgi:hypothetical protein